MKKEEVSYGPNVGSPTIAKLWADRSRSIPFIIIGVLLLIKVVYSFMFRTGTDEQWIQNAFSGSIVLWLSLYASAQVVRPFAPPANAQSPVTFGRTRLFTTIVMKSLFTLLTFLALALVVVIPPLLMGYDVTYLLCVLVYAAGFGILCVTPICLESELVDEETMWKFSVKRIILFLMFFIPSIVYDIFFDGATNVSQVALEVRLLGIGVLTLMLSYPLAYVLTSRVKTAA